MTTIEAVETLTEIVSRQAVVISKLCSVLEQLNAVTSFDEEIEELQRQAADALSKGGDLL